jgi:erythromycin esterase
MMNRKLTVLVICFVWLAASLAACLPRIQEQAVTAPVPDPTHQIDQQSGSQKSALSAAGPLATAYAQAAEVKFSTPPPAEIPPGFETWLEGRSQPIASLTSDDFSDLEFLEPLLEGKRIVQLGEDDHWTREQSLIKVRLIQYLHQELDYEVIAFESGLLDCYLTYQQIDQYSAREAMERSIFAVWHTEAVLPLFEYLITTSESPSPLILAGFDSQPSGAQFDTSPEFFYQILVDLDRDYAERIREIETYFYQVGYQTDWEKRAAQLINQKNALTAYEELVEFIAEHSREINAQFPDHPQTAEVASQAAWSRAQFLKQIHNRSNGEKSFNIRDHAMAQNAIFLAEELYPDKKIILWAHNGHISEQSAKAGLINYGNYLDDRYGESLFSLGLFGYRNSLNRYSLASYLHSYGTAALFINLEQPAVQDSFKPRLPEYQYPAGTYFDALIYLDQITYPTYLGD